MPGKLTARIPDIRHALDPSVQLSEIAGQTLRLECAACGHEGTVTATDLMKSVGAAETVLKALSKTKCGSCGSARLPIIRLSDQAM